MYYAALCLRRKGTKYFIRYHAECLMSARVKDVRGFLVHFRLQFLTALALWGDMYDVKMISGPDKGVLQWHRKKWKRV